MTNLVVVYGTLKKGFPLHDNMEESKLLGVVQIDGFGLYSKTDFPVAVREEGKSIWGEVYDTEGDDGLMDFLDLIEGHSPDKRRSIYHREIVSTPYGDAWMYVYQKNVDKLKPVTLGVWPPQPKTIGM